ncbi:MAG: hypothetical protein U9R17_06630 [Thermodesulfobacteriota bacterium]|nr:hypothetical protein [Thermodesulfobacteriota bacterium]
MTRGAAQDILPLHKTVKQQKLGINERMGLIGLIYEGMKLGSTESPDLPDLFNDLWDLVNKTISGSKIGRLKPENSQNGFSVFEINAESGENLGRLNMLYLKKPIPCYYLVYVEVALPFRNKGLGNRILEYFRDFLIKKSAVGILDNIIPEEDPTYNIYLKQAWEPVEAIIGYSISGNEDNYMIFVPPRFQNKDIRDSVLKLVQHLKRKRDVIDMRDNELMVSRTIAEFREVYSALLTYFNSEIEKGEASVLMRFMFTRFITKLIAFRRRIGELLGYTGGDSLEQIVLSPKVAALPLQSYAPPNLSSKPSFVMGDKNLQILLPEAFKKNPAHFVESLPNYSRPSLLAWLKEQGKTLSHVLTIGDLMDIGFDPTRLKEITINDNEFIFERIQVKQLPELEKKKELMEKIASRITGGHTMGFRLKSNPPLLTIRNRGNAYILRRKVAGIHWEEAVEQLQTAPHLKDLNASTKVDRIIISSVQRAKDITAEELTEAERSLIDLLTCFVSWDLRSNRPKLIIDFSGTFIESVWMA